MLNLIKLFAVDGPLTRPKSLPVAEKLSSGNVSNVMRFVFALAGALTLLVIVIASLRYTLSRGDANAIKTSKEAIIYALIGLVIALSGYAIVTYVFGKVSS